MTMIMSKETKILEQHKTKLAYIYLRQSSLGQVRLNQESTERQYALQKTAHQLGWSKDLIKVLDGDLGISGSHSSNREDFKILVADVSMGKVGAIFAIEASRFSRSCTDWHRLLEICAFTGTLIIDEDGCYDTTDFNDQLLLGLKGTMSQAELHFIRARLLGGKINKAKKGELHFALPVGYRYDSEGKTVFDEDKQIYATICLFFKINKEQGSAYKVAHYFNNNKIKFPKRTYGGAWKGKVIWSNLSHARAIAVLKNPSYAGAYVYGRYKYLKQLSIEGNIKAKTVILPEEKWHTTIKDHHEAYITWDEFVANKQKLINNRTNMEENILPGPAREGSALLQGLLLCGHCGRRVSIRYRTNRKIRTSYECNGRKRDGLTHKACLSVYANLLDLAISERLIEVIKPAQVEIAIKAFEELEQRKQSMDKQWNMKIMRIEYESQLAQRRYEEVDPSNRLVAGTLEQRWNEKLEELENVKAQHAEYQKQESLQTTTAHKDSIISLARDFSKLWNAETTTNSDKKRILRLLVKDVTLNRVQNDHSNNKDKNITKEIKAIAIMHIRWHGGAVESISVSMPPKSSDKWRHSDFIINEVRLLAQNLTDEQIVNELNQRGLKTNKGNPYTVCSINWMRYKHKIPSARLGRPGELKIKEVMKKFDVSYYVVYYWIERKIVTSRHIGFIIWVTITLEKELELQQWVANSTKIKLAKCQNNIARGVL